MPRKVDHEERRRHIVEALLRIAGTRGLDAVSLREVAQEAEVSMGAVQHYFSSKEEMLVYALSHWLSLSVHGGFTGRVRARLAKQYAGDTSPHTILMALAAEYLPRHEPSRFDARLAVAFHSLAAFDPHLAKAAIPAFAGFAGTLRALLANANAELDAEAEAQRLAALLDGLRMPVLVGALSHKHGLALVERHLHELYGAQGGLSSQLESAS
jgi:AcrR family transcriptional regulator